MKSRINFANDKSSVSLDFAWKDTIKNEYYYSNNIAFEYYSVLFNLATIYALIVYFLYREKMFLII